MTAPAFFRWDGEAMVPLRPRAADRDFVIGQIYRMAVEEERSIDSHRHEFAWLREAWRSLPEGIAEDFPTPEHLRKRALIETGWYQETILDVGSKAGALRTARFLRAKDDFAHVVTRGEIVVIREPKSQSVRAMGAAEFQKSKQAILEWIAALIGVKPEELGKQKEAA